MIPVYVVTAEGGDGCDVLAAFHTEGEARAWFHEYRKGAPYERAYTFLRAWVADKPEVLLQPCGAVTLSGQGRVCDKVAGHLGACANTAHAEYLANWYTFMGMP